MKIWRSDGSQFKIKTFPLRWACPAGFPAFLTREIPETEDDAVGGLSFIKIQRYLILKFIPIKGSAKFNLLLLNPLIYSLDNKQ